MTAQPLWTSLRVDYDFDDIRVVDMDVSKTTWSRIHESMRVVYLKLSAPPPDAIWVRYFFEDRESRICIQHRGIWLEHGYISFDCLPKDIESFHIPDIKRSVAYANAKYADYVKLRKRENDEARHAEQQEIEELEKLRARLKF
jgi:hypothetical protein